jgi:hypothetical protein
MRSMPPDWWPAERTTAPPGRPVYHAHYHGACVYDPDGNNIEAVCHRPVSPA